MTNFVSTRLLRLPAGLLLLGLLALACSSLRPDFPRPRGGERVELELLPTATGIEPGGEMLLLARFRLERDWHLYWINPGDSGLAPLLSWTLPEGWSAGEPVFPVPAVKASSVSLSYIHEELLLVIALRAPASARPGTVATLGLHADWLACREACVPGEARLQLQLPVVEQASLRPHGQRLLQEARRRWPQGKAPGHWQASLDEDGLRLDLQSGSWRLPERAHLLPVRQGWLDERAGAWQPTTTGARWHQPRLAWGEEPPDTLLALLIDLDAPVHRPRAWWLRLPLTEGSAPDLPTEHPIERTTP
jgi:DsbC/DsbD-like thiol-disulfide interchange protein